MRSLVRHALGTFRATLSRPNSRSIRSQLFRTPSLQALLALPQVFIGAGTLALTGNMALLGVPRKRTGKPLGTIVLRIIRTHSCRLMPKRACHALLTIGPLVTMAFWALEICTWCSAGPRASSYGRRVWLAALQADLDGGCKMHGSRALLLTVLHACGLDRPLSEDCTPAAHEQSCFLCGSRRSATSCLRTNAKPQCQ